ncbi:MAG: YXWGXW repeat-containing protein [Acetobacteraceae bacterium]|nr:YXWGXW repeat-containing protein [Acetobacteraceae bacterium]
MRERILALGLVSAFLALSGCVVRQPMPPPPPPATTEVVPNPPVSATPLIWQPGHWDWNGAAYVWVPGQFVPREGHGPMWMPGHWAQTPTGGWAWQPPHWM